MSDVAQAAADSAVVVVGPEGMLEVWPRLLEKTATSSYAMATGVLSKLRLYDAYGRVSRIRDARPPFEFGAVRRFLARTVYNPRFDVRLEYDQAEAYDLSELKDQILTAIALDDDVITQFHDANTISAWIRGAANFQEVVAALTRAQQEGDEA